MMHSNCPNQLKTSFISKFTCRIDEITENAFEVSFEEFSSVTNSLGESLLGDNDGHEEGQQYHDDCDEKIKFNKDGGGTSSETVETLSLSSSELSSTDNHSEFKMSDASLNCVGHKTPGHETPTLDTEKKKVTCDETTKLSKIEDSSQVLLVESDKDPSNQVSRSENDALDDEQKTVNEDRELEDSEGKENLHSSEEVAVYGVDSKLEPKFYSPCARVLLVESDKDPSNQVSRSENDALDDEQKTVNEDRELEDSEGKENLHSSEEVAVYGVDSKLEPKSYSHCERLYNQAFERRVANSTPKASSLSPTKRNLKQRSTCSNASPKKSSKRNVKQKSICLTDPPKKILGSNDACIRLYNRSTNKQEDGKKRRKSIEKTILKAREIHACRKKISLKDADRFYYEGVQSLVDLDARRSEAAGFLQTKHQPYRFPLELKVKAKLVKEMK